jgi:DNA-directed RNA polymerase beta' subunit
MAAHHVLEALKGLDLERMREEAYADVRSGKKTRRQKAVKVLRALEGLERSGASPEDLMVSRVPVIPPQFRPYAVAGETFIPGDANELYSDLIRAVQTERQAREVLGPQGTRASRRYIRQAVRAAYGYDESPNPKIKSRRISGLFQKIIGSGPKVSFVQSKLVSKPQDFVGRGVISPDPELGMDEVGIPEKMAWEIFAPHIRRRLAAQGIPASRAIRMIKDHDPTARRALDAEMRERPVNISRAPAWHKFNFISSYAKIAEGDNIKVSPLTTQGMGADHDGDSGRFWLPIEFLLDKTVSKNYTDLMPFANNTIQTAVRAHCRIEDLPLVEGSATQLSPNIVEYDVVPGVKALTYDVETREIAWMPITKFSKHENIVLHTVTVGRDSFLASEDHSLLAFSRLSNTVEKMSPSATQTLNKSELNWFAPVSRDLGVSCGEHATEIDGPFNNPVPADYALGFALGVYVGDGAFSLTHKRLFDGKSWVYALYLYGGASDGSRRKQKTHMEAALTLWSMFKLNSDTPRYDEYARESLGGKLGSSGRMAINAGEDQSLMRAGYEWLKRLCGESAESKHMPGFMLDLNEDFRWGLFCGLLASDGTITTTNGKSKPQLVVALNSITSETLASDFAALCRSLGLGSTISIAKRKTSTGKSEFSVPVSTSDLAARYRNQPFSIGCEVRDKLLAEYLPQIRIENTFDPLPFPGGELGLAYRDAFWVQSGSPRQKTRNKRDFGAAAVWMVQGYWHRKSAKQHLDRLHTWTVENRPALKEMSERYLQIVRDEKLMWREVKTGPETITTVAYDITVPGPYTFATAGGTFVQDTMSVHVPSLPASVKDSKEKLLPSKMLFTIRSRDKVMPQPKHEMVLGLASAQLKPSANIHRFNSQDEALAAIQRGEVKLQDRIELPEFEA